MDKILVTDSFFIHEKQITKLNKAGFEVVRLDKAKASENELSEHIKDKVGYILGGIEKVTPKVIACANKLKAIAFTGTEYKEHIVAWQEAASKNIRISTTPFANSRAVAEWTLTGTLAMVRDLFELGRTGKQLSRTVPGFSDLHVGIIGLGHVGEYLADMFDDIGFKVSYWNRSSKDSRYQKLALNDLLESVDIACFCVSSDAGKSYISKEKLALLKYGAIVIAFKDLIVDEDALLSELKSGRLRALLDFKPSNKEFSKIPMHNLYFSNVKTSYNTSQANEVISDMATDSIINLLTKGTDKYSVK